MLQAKAIKCLVDDQGEANIMLGVTGNIYHIKQQVKDLQEILAKGKDLSVEIKQHRQRRSLDANAYAWLLIGKLAESLNLSPLEVYQKHIKEVGIYRDIELEAKGVDTLIHSWGLNGMGWLACQVDHGANEGFVVVRLYYGSSAYNTKQMARLIDNIVADCKALDIETLPPMELERLVDSWKA